MNINGRVPKGYQTDDKMALFGGDVTVLDDTGNDLHKIANITVIGTANNAMCAFVEAFKTDNFGNLVVNDEGEPEVVKKKFYIKSIDIEGLEAKDV